MTERLARFSARKAKLVLGVWAVLVLVGGALAVDGEMGPGVQLADVLDRATTTELRLSGGAESRQAEDLLEERLRGPQQLTEIVIVQSDTLTVQDPAFQAKVEAVYGDVGALGTDVVTPGPNVYNATNPLVRQGLVSQDLRTTIMPMEMTGDFEGAVDNVAGVLEVVEHADGEDGFRVLTVGEASVAHEQNELSETDLQQGERVGIPVALLILVVLFGTVVAVLMPIGLSLVCIIVAMGIAALIGQVVDLVFFVTLMIVMIGLAVGIDYSLLIISRYRDETARGLGKYEAIARAGATAGRTVLFSGLTVVIALCGILIVPFSFFQSLGLGAILVVLVALAGTLTFLPASLAVLGDKIDRLPIPIFGRKRGQASESSDSSKGGFWDRVTHTVMRYPVLSIIVVSAPMIVITLFYFQWPGIKTGLNGVDVFPEGAQTREAFFVIEEAFPFGFGAVTPTEVVIDGDIGSPEVQAAAGRLQTSLAEHPGLTVFPPEVNESRDLALLTVLIPGETRRQETVDVITTIREEYIPAAFGDVDARGAGGRRQRRSRGRVRHRGAVHHPRVCLRAGIQLPGADAGLPVHRHPHQGRLHEPAVGGDRVRADGPGVPEGDWRRSVRVPAGGGHRRLDTAVPVLNPVRAVHGLPRVPAEPHPRAVRTRRETTRRRWAYGLRSTAGIITGAALIMVAVFGAFASGDTIINQQVGFGLSVAILLDATLVRSILVPASMEVLGKRNWYLPSWLRWLPDLRVEAEEEEETHGTAATGSPSS